MHATNLALLDYVSIAHEIEIWPSSAACRPCRNYLRTN